MKKLLPLVALLCFAPKLFALNVTNLTATYKYGQVFLVWNNPKKTQLKYKVYRSVLPILLTSDLNNATYLGFVRDSSAKNLRMSLVRNAKVYFKIDSLGSPLTGKNGLFVATTSTTGSFYYAVTILKNDGTEDKTLITGSSTLLLPVIEIPAIPRPIWQDNSTNQDGSTSLNYVHFVNKIATGTYAAMSSEGCYYYNFATVKRGSGTKLPLVIFFESCKPGFFTAKGMDQFENNTITNCCLMGFDDWLPVNNGNATGNQTAKWIGYHENFDIYAKTNPTPASGTVHLYTIYRLAYTIEWAKKYMDIDTSRIYLVGNSTGGYGCIINSQVIRDKVAAIYTMVSPYMSGSGDSFLNQIWGKKTTNLNTDLNNPLTNTPFKIYDLTNAVTMIENNESFGLPLYFLTNGKNDNTVGWKYIPDLYDQVNLMRYGGRFYWDQRDHNMNGNNFLISEVTPDFFRYKTNKSFPALTYCSINQNYGDGSSSTSGVSYGVLNGYVDWDDDITDTTCAWKINLKVIDLYVGGALASTQYNSATADVSLRRIQKFHPSVGTMIYWKNTNSSNSVVQMDSFVYDGGTITIPEVKISRNGNDLEVYTCPGQRLLQPSVDKELHIVWYKQGNEWTAEFYSNVEEDVVIHSFDMYGRMIEQKELHIIYGLNRLKFEYPVTGVVTTSVQGHFIRFNKQLLFVQ